MSTPASSPPASGSAASNPIEAPRSKSRLHVPATPARPGAKPDFSYLRVSPAGAMPRPPIDAKAVDIEELSRGLVRVLDDAHQPVGPWRLTIDVAVLKQGLRHMLLTRLFDKRMQRTHRQGRISFYIQSVGEEAVSVAQAMALQPQDMLFPSYRNQGLFVTRGVPLVDLMSQLLANQHDMCKGRQTAGDVSLRTETTVLDFRQPRHAVPAGRGLGNGLCHQG